MLALAKIKKIKYRRAQIGTEEFFNMFPVILEIHDKMLLIKPAYNLENRERRRDDYPKTSDLPSFCGYTPLRVLE